MAGELVSPGDSIPAASKNPGESATSSTINSSPPDNGTALIMPSILSTLVSIILDIILFSEKQIPLLTEPFSVKVFPTLYPITQYSFLAIESINNLNDSISNINNEKSNSDFALLLSEVQGIFEKINDNIRMVQELKLASEQISDKVVNLLIQIESKPDNPESYKMQVQELKDSINDFSIKMKTFRQRPKIVILIQ